MSGVLAEPRRCSYVLPKKNRKCRMLVKPNNLFCGEHAVHEKDNQNRIPCPNDSKHTVAKSELEQHLKRCNSRISDEPWIQEGLNAINGETKFDDKIDRRPSPEELESIASRILECYDRIRDDIIDSQLTTDRIDEFLAQNGDLGDSNRKHLIQQSSIIGHMLRASLLKDEDSSCIFELGAGKAQLAYWMAKVAPKGRFLLVDRSGARNKYDNQALREDPALNMTRLRCSIEHLDLSKVDLLKDASSLGAVCKHFCGSATDAGVRCLINGVGRGLPLNGLVLVPCCHHKSRFAEYCGRGFLADCKIDNETDFCALRHVASWATCGMTKVHDEAIKQTADGAIEALATEGNDEPSPPKKICLEVVDTLVEVSDQLPWSPAWKESLGRKAKALLETGRARYLSSLGFSTSVIRYVPHTVSPENLLILGVKRV